MTSLYVLLKMLVAVGLVVKKHTRLTYSIHHIVELPGINI